MKTWHSVFLVSLFFAAVSGHVVAADEHHHHAHEANAPQKLELNSGKKWATDVPLRKAMSDINQEMKKAVPLIHHNKFEDANYQSLATLIGQKVGYAIEHCKLEPKADAMLHLIIAELTAGADTMAGQTTHSRHDGAVQILNALKSYGQYFQHRDWKAARG